MGVAETVEARSMGELDDEEEDAEERRVEREVVSGEVVMATSGDDERLVMREVMVDGKRGVIRPEREGETMGTEIEEERGESCC